MSDFIRQARRGRGRWMGGEKMSDFIRQARRGGNGGRGATVAQPAPPFHCVTQVLMYRYGGVYFDYDTVRRSTGDACVEPRAIMLPSSSPPSSRHRLCFRTSGLSWSSSTLYTGAVRLAG